MKSSRLLASILVFTALATTGLLASLATGRTPVLGLDLKGGLSAIYATEEPASADDLIVVRDLMRDQLESFGIAEPDVRVEGENIIADLPGVTDQEQAFEALKVSGIVELRPVFQCQVVSIPTGSVPTGTSVPGATVPGSSVPADTTSIGSSVPAGSEESSASSGQGLRSPVSRARSPRAASATTPPTAPPTVPDTTPLPTVPPTEPPVLGPTLPPPTTQPPPVDTSVDQPDTSSSGQETLFTKDRTQLCLVGPAGGTGEVFERGSARRSADQAGGLAVTVDLKPAGLAAWNALARVCNAGDSTCPSRQLAIVLDDVIQSAPTVQQPEFTDTVQITGQFSAEEVDSLVRVLNRGAFPVKVVQQRVETVSPTAGKDSLNAAILAGLIGIAVMLLFMIVYYRKLALVIIGGLLVWGVTVFALASFVSNTWNFALTLAGATGIIVAVGVTVDTYVVFFERIRDETRHGRTLLNAAPRSFASSWRTIWAADLVSLLASFVLFWLSVGSVKGFALYLGLTTICDLLVFYFVTRPAVYLLARTRWFSGSRHATVAPAVGGAS